MTKEQRLKKRHNAEKRFRLYGLASIFFALLFVLILVHNIFSKGSSAFMKTAINVEVFFDKDLLELEPGATEDEILEASNISSSVAPGSNSRRSLSKKTSTFIAVFINAELPFEKMLWTKINTNNNAKKIDAKP